MKQFKRGDIVRSTRTGVVDGSRFNWEKYRDGTWVGTVHQSEINDVEIFHRIYIDAADVGFEVKGRRETKLFTFARTMSDKEENVTGWIFIAKTGEEVIVYND